jgi:hypothetical protein
MQNKLPALKIKPSANGHNIQELGTASVLTLGWMLGNILENGARPMYK